MPYSTDHTYIPPKDANEDIADLMRNTNFGFSVQRLGRDPNAPPTHWERRIDLYHRAVRWAYENRSDVWTPAQAAAVVLVYRDGLTRLQAAAALGLSRQAFDDRLHRAEEHAYRAYGRFNGSGEQGSRYARKRPKKGRAS